MYNTHQVVVWTSFRTQVHHHYHMNILVSKSLGDCPPILEGGHKLFVFRSCHILGSPTKPPMVKLGSILYSSIKPEIQKYISEEGTNRITHRFKIRLMLLLLFSPKQLRELMQIRGTSNLCLFKHQRLYTSTRKPLNGFPPRKNCVTSCRC